MFSICMHTDFKSEVNLNLFRPKRTVPNYSKIFFFSLPTSLTAILDLTGTEKT